MKRFFQIFLFLFVIFQYSADGKPWRHIRVAIEGAYPPFSEITPEGNMVGFDIDITHALCREMKADCRLVAQDWEGLIPALLAGKYDAIIASMNITEERKQKVAFTDKYYQTPARFVVHQDFVIRILKGEEWKKVVGVQRATIHDNYVTDNFGDSVIIKRYGNLNEAYLDMKAGRLDMLLADTIGLSEGFLKLKGNEAFQFIGPELTDPKWFGEGCGIAIRKENRDLVDQFNRAIKAIRANGTYQKIQARYFDFDIYGE